MSACHTTTGGNPFVVHSLLVDLAAGGVRPDDGAAAGLQERSTTDFGRALRLRLESLPPDATRLAGAAAVLGDGCALHTAARLVDLNVDEAARMRDLLVRLDVLAAGRELRLTLRWRGRRPTGRFPRGRARTCTPTRPAC